MIAGAMRDPETRLKNIPTFDGPIIGRNTPHSVENPEMQKGVQSQ